MLSGNRTEGKGEGEMGGKVERRKWKAPIKTKWAMTLE